MVVPFTMFFEEVTEDALPEELELAAEDLESQPLGLVVLRQEVDDALRRAERLAQEQREMADDVSSLPDEPAARDRSHRRAFSTATRHSARAFRGRTNRAATFLISGCEPPA